MRFAGVTLVAALIGLSCCQQLSGRIAQFSGSIEPVRWADLRFSYRVGCPVPPAGLRTVRVSYWDFAGRAREGRIVVARAEAANVVTVFRELWAARFPIRKLEPVSAYRGSDDRSMAADNTSGFNCRFVGGTKRWSMHAYGLAIDVNPVENPYVRGSTVSPPAGRAYLDRSRYRKGMAVRGGVLVRAFASVGWKWGASFGDYQHFSTTGR
ncbi:MAG TPA: M15 family metallopeptidase [Gaiellaceae bacterium]|nr:M15 family metallopeptidase [Gaiellaceae bacterium]